MKRYFEKMKDPGQRKLFYAIFGGKMLGLALCFGLILGISAYLASTKAHAQTPATAPAPGAAPAAPAAAAPAPAAPAVVPDPPYCSPINTMWVLVTAFLAAWQPVTGRVVKRKR